MTPNKYFPTLPGATLDVRQELIELRKMIYSLSDKVGTGGEQGVGKLTPADLEFIRKNLQVGGKAPINVTNLLGGNTTSGQTTPITSVGLSMPGEFTVDNSPITSGEATIMVEKADQVSNRVYASPDGSSGEPTFRALVVSDVPNLPESKITNLTTDLAGKVPTSRTISTTAPLTGGGDLTSNRTLGVSTATTGALGVVRPDGTTITISSGVISATGVSWPAWTNYTPTITGTGSMTVSGVTVTGAHYIQFGPVVMFEYRVSFTLGGAQANRVDATLPVNTAGSFSNTVDLVANLAAGGYNPGIASVGSNKVAMFLAGQGLWNLGTWEVIVQGFYQA